MKKRRFFALFLVLGLLVSLLSVPASAFEEIDVDARAALLVEKETGEILYEKNAHEKNYPASITKLTVALLVFEAIDAGQLSLDQPITAHESAFEGLSIYGSTAGIKVGEVLTVEQLLPLLHDDLRHKDAALRPRAQQKLRRQLQQAGKHRLARVAVLQTVGKQARQLDLALFSHERPDGRAAERVQPVRDRADGGRAFTAAQQNARQQRVHAGFLLPERPEEAEAEAGGLEAAGLHGGQIDVRQKFESCCHLISSPPPRAAG